jgi:hypothetical protein
MPMLEVNQAMGDEDTIDTNVLDQFDAIYANIKDEVHMLKSEVSKSKGFCSHSGDIKLSTTELPLNSCNYGHLEKMMLGIFVSTSYISMDTSYSLLFNVILIVRPPTLGSVVFRHSVHMTPFTIMLKNFGKEKKYEPSHL